MVFMMRQPTKSEMVFLKCACFLPEDSSYVVLKQHDYFEHAVAVCAISLHSAEVPTLSSHLLSSQY